MKELLQELVQVFVTVLIFIILINMVNNYNMNSESFQNPHVQLLKNNVDRKQYRSYTLTKELKEELNNVITTILTDLNNLSVSKYYPGEYESVTIETDQNNSKRYLIDMFMYDIKKRYNIRLLIDVTNVNQEYILNNVRMVQADKVNNPSVDQDVYGIHKTKILDNDFIESCSQKNILGFQESVLKTSEVEYKNTPQEQEHIVGNPGNIRNKWIVDKNSSKECTDVDDRTFNKNVLCTWDKYGTLTTHKSKHYTRWPSYNPTIIGLPHHEKDKDSMFYLARGIVDFPHGQA